MNALSEWNSFIFRGLTVVTLKFVMKNNNSYNNLLIDIQYLEIKCGIKPIKGERGWKEQSLCT